MEEYVEKYEFEEPREFKDKNVFTHGLFESNAIIFGFPVTFQCMMNTLLRLLSTVFRAAPLHDLVKNILVKQQHAFEELKERLITAQILIHFNFSKAFTLFMDAFTIGLDVILSQRDQENRERPRGDLGSSTISPVPTWTALRNNNGLYRAIGDSTNPTTENYQLVGNRKYWGKRKGTRYNEDKGKRTMDLIIFNNIYQFLDTEEFRAGLSAAALKWIRQMAKSF
ncbi:8167_t:CDS:2, partial [Ambispora leptoticha]